MAITGLDHINIYTAKLAETRRFFSEALGLEDGWRPNFGAPGAWLYQDGRAVVHLVETDAPRAPCEASAVNHFAFGIDDWQGAVDRLTVAGVAFRTTDVPGASIRQIFLTDPNGVAIELNWQPK
ncbi:MAG TPA: VOC family protein [Caulobacteraceae bacterium]|nr:VOC family protein [Caulobacteraceae bacterium]